MWGLYYSVGVGWGVWGASVCGCVWGGVCVCVNC